MILSTDKQIIFQERIMPANETLSKSAQPKRLSTERYER